MYNISKYNNNNKRSATDSPFDVQDLAPSSASTSWTVSSLGLLLWSASFPHRVDWCWRIFKVGSLV